VELFGDQILDFYNRLSTGPPVPDNIQVLCPHRQKDAQKAMKQFYTKYYSDENKRTYLIGINPGRLGAGTTGIPFTDPIRLLEICGINNSFEKKAELSSKFVYQMIAACGGAESFYANCYFTSVSPLGFTKDGKNLNYYDLRELQESWEGFMVEALQRQLKFGCRQVAFSLGQGKNYHYLQMINQKYGLFAEIRPLPHPRWIMQYRLKKLQEFLDLYKSQLIPFFN